MPYSANFFDYQIENFLINHKLDHYLDIGPGAGKYGKMIRKIYPNAHIDAVEVDRKYIKQFSLRKIYNKVYNQKIEAFIDKMPDYSTDIAIIGDCIEHLKKSDGIDLLNYLVYRCKFIIVLYPVKVIQYSWNGHSSEAHRSVWTRNDFRGFTIDYHKKKFITMVIVKGYIGARGAKEIK